MRQPSTDTVDKSVCTEESGAARLEAVLVALVERKARALHAEHARRARTHPLLLLLRNHVPDEEASIVGSPDGAPPAHWCEHELARHQRRKLKLKSHHGGELDSPEELELERRRRRRRRRRHEAAARAQHRVAHRTLLVSAIDEQAKVIHVLDPDELPRRARYTIMVTACLLLFLCLLLVGVTLRMAPLIDDMDQVSSFFGPMLAFNYLFHLISCCLLLLECSQGSEKLNDSVYFVPWECMDVRNRRSVCFLLSQMQTPITVKAMGLTYVGVTTMAGILKTTFSFFTFLRSMDV